MNVRPLGAPNTAPTFADLSYGDLFLHDGKLCVKCQDIDSKWSGFMFMDTGYVFTEAPDRYAPAPGEWVVSNGEAQ